MYKRHITLIYALNIMFQAIFTLALGIGAALFISYIATSNWGAPDWIYAPLVTVGVLIGLVSMLKYLFVAMRSLEKLEQQHKQDEKRAREEARQKKKRDGEGENNNGSREV